MKRYIFLFVVLFFGSIQIFSQNEICGTPDPQIQVPVDPSYQLSNPIQIPVFFHIILSSTGEGNVSDSQLSDQIIVLNQRYSGTYFSFYLVGITRSKNDDWRGLIRPQQGGIDPDEIDMKENLAIDPVHVFNIYITKLEDASSTIQGWSILPKEYQFNPEYHGVVIKPEVLPGGSEINYNLGITAVHETGHYLGLLHTFFQGTPCKSGVDPDSCEDTPPHLVNTGTPPDNTNTCPSPGFDPVHNYMNYTYDNWRNQFTVDQKYRIRSKVDQYMSDLGGSNIYIDASRTINSGDSWEIFSGNYYFSNGASLEVNGTLNVNGTLANPVTFDFTSPNSSTQNGIKINNGGNADISNAIIKNAYRGVYIADNRPSISNSEFIDCYYGIYLDNTNYGGYDQSYLTDNKIHGSDIGIVMYTSGPYITGNEIYDNRIAVGAAENSKPYLGYAGSYGNNNIHDNDYGIFAFDYSDPFLGRSTCTIQGGNNSITNSENYAVYAYDYCDIVAENNWWGSSSPSSSLFHPGNGGTIDYNPWLSQLPNLNLMISDRSNSPEEKAFDVAFKAQSSNSTKYLVTNADAANSYNADWPIRWKLYYVRNLIDVRKTEFAAKICKEIILQNPDSALSFPALNLLWRASATDGNSFKEFLVLLADKNKENKNKVELYSLAELILANNYSTSDKTTKLDNVISLSKNTRIIESALMRKFLYYINNKKDFGEARNVANEISQRFPNSIISEEINWQLNGPDNYFISLKKSKLSAETQLPKEYSLLGNYPNPFNPSTKIRYTLPFNSDVEITIYNINGQIVKAFKYGSQSAGVYDVKWDGTNINNEQVSSGIYLYHFKAVSLRGNQIFEKSAKLILMK